MSQHSNAMANGHAIKSKPPAPTEMLDAALNWLHFGLQVIPLNSNKQTITKWRPWLSDLDEGKVLSTWRENPSYQVGAIMTPDLFVIDADHPDAIAAMERIEAEHGIVCNQVHKTSKGVHHLFRRGDGTAARCTSCSTEGHPSGIDVRTARGRQSGEGMLVLPPSGGREVVTGVESVADLAEVGQAFIDAIYVHNESTKPARGTRIVIPKGDALLEPVGDADYDDAVELLNNISPNCGYEDWLRVGMALQSKFGAQGLGLWDTWSANGADYPGPGELEYKWGTFTGSGITMGTLAYMAGTTCGQSPTGPEEDFVGVQSEEAPPPAGKSSPFYVFTRSGIGPEETFGPHEPPTVPFIIGEILPATSFGIAGAGGSMKSTTMLRIMIHVVLGLPIFGREILRPGPCVFVTSEDDLMTIRHRVRRMVDAMMLTPEQRHKIGTDLIIEDTNGTIARVVEQDKKGNLQYSAMFDQMLNIYAGANLSIVCFDPMIYFGPGENFVNDGPGLLMNAARKLSAELGCATGYLHHVGQEAFRNDTVDMYAGRGGTAFADNARMMGIMTRPTQVKKFPMPDEIAEGTQKGAQVVQFHIAKLSYAKPPSQPIWIMRDLGDPWRFHDVWGTASDEVDAVQRAEEADTEQRLEILAAVWAHLKDEGGKGRYPNKTSLRENLTVKVANKKVGKQRLADMVEVGIQVGFIREEELPDGARQGARKYYLIACSKEPFIGAGGLTPRTRE